MAFVENTVEDKDYAKLKENFDKLSTNYEKLSADFGRLTSQLTKQENSAAWRLLC